MKSEDMMKLINEIYKKYYSDVWDASEEYNSKEEWTVQPMTSLWDAVKNFFVEANQNDLGYHTRIDLINYLTNRGFTHFQNSMDTYRNYLYKAGYIRTVRRGVYDLENEIPTDLSISDVKNEAYGDKDEITLSGLKELIIPSIKKERDFLSKDDFML